MTYTDAPKPPKPKQFTHATYIETRSPKWKYHSNIGHAKNAVTHMARESFIYEVDSSAEGGLRLLWHITPDMYSYHNEKMPWKNTAEELEKQRQEDIRRLKSRLRSLITEAQSVAEELRKVQNDTD